MMFTLRLAVSRFCVQSSGLLSTIRDGFDVSWVDGIFWLKGSNSYIQGGCVCVCVCTCACAVCKREGGRGVCFQLVVSLYI